MTRCAAPHPEGGADCTLPPIPHLEHRDRAGTRWANEDARMAARRAEHGVGGLDRARRIARAVPPRETVRLLPVNPVERSGPTPGSQEDAVLAHLRDGRPRQWVTGAELVAVAGPGAAQVPPALARAGWPVESRWHGGVWEHRLVLPREDLV